jgi:hypothetical protein
MSELFSSIPYLPLRANQEELIGTVWNIIFSDGRIFLFERSTPTVFIYTEDGRYLNRISIPERSSINSVLAPFPENSPCCRGQFCLVHEQLSV